MNWTIFFEVYFLLQLLVVAQTVAAFYDHRLTQAQMENSTPKIYGYSFMDHGGMWYDFIAFSPLTAYVLSRYQIVCGRWQAAVGLCVFILVTKILGPFYRTEANKRKDPESGRTWGEAHNHDGKTTLAGIIHGGYAIFVMSVLLLFYLGFTSPITTKSDLFWITAALTPFFPLGVMKFHRHWFAQWSTDTFAHWQSFAGPVALWTITLIRIAFL